MVPLDGWEWLEEWLDRYGSFVVVFVVCVRGTSWLTVHLDRWTPWRRTLVLLNVNA